MPKKTKQEKIIAQLRRKLETVKPLSFAKYQIPNTKYIPNQPTVILNQNSGYIFSDLKKTFILAALAIGLEFVIYWLSELGGSRLFKF